MTAAFITPIDLKTLDALFVSRKSNSHKGSFGTVGIIGGGPGMTGAALLAGRAALRLGAGKVLIGFTETPAPLPCDVLQPELMCRDAASLIGEDLGITTWVAGCGAGRAEYAIQVIQTLISEHGDVPLVLDADALNLVASGHLTLKSARRAALILTPHPAEAGRLLELTSAQIQTDRASAARALSDRYGAWVVLKGAETLVCAPDGVLRQNTSGNPALATAGTGDVLAGMLGSLIAQGIPLPQAICGAVWLHGAAADASVAAGVGPIGFTAGELADWARKIRNGQMDKTGAKTTL